MTSTPTSSGGESEPDPDAPLEPEADAPPEFGFGVLPEPAGDLRAPTAPSTMPGVVRGRSVEREASPEAPKTEEKPPEPELVSVTADGQEYVPKETKNVSDHPLYKLRVEVSKDGEPILADGPQFVDQFTNPAFAKTVVPGPFQVKVCDLSTEQGVADYNELLSLREPMGCPRVQMLEQDRQFDAHAGNWKVFVMFRRISYRKVVT
jgi:hypothetical protein